MIGVIVFLLAAAWLFITFWPAFGGHASSKDEVDYAKRSEVFSDGHFHNEEEFTVMVATDEKDPYTISEKDTEPKEELPVKDPSFETSDMEDVQVTWMGHSILLIQMHGKNIVVDPMLGERSSPVSFTGGTVRFSHPPFTIKDLPHIDVVLISHDHFDHLDMDSIKEIAEKTDHFFVPLGIEKDLEKWGIKKKRIQNFAWWEETELDGLTIACTPARHYSIRNGLDMNETLWCSWVLKDEYHQIFESGDTGYGKQFEEIHDRYGDFDFAMVDCAQYDMTWPMVHMFPEEAVQAVRTLNSSVVMPIHWGAFSLANHGWDDPPERIVKAGEAAGLTVTTPYIGETMKLSEVKSYQERWWKEIS